MSAYPGDYGTLVYRARPFLPDDLYPLSPTREKGSSKGQYWNAINSLKPYEWARGQKPE